MNCTAGPEVLGERAFRRHKVFAISGRTCELNTASDTAEGAVPHQNPVRQQSQFPSFRLVFSRAVDALLPKTVRLLISMTCA